MKQILNLTNKEKSPIQYTTSDFPDGQQSLTIDTKSIIPSTDEVEIKSRFNSFRDLELIICATAALKNLMIEKIHLYIPHCLGGRSDRKFSEGGINYVKNIVAPIINAQEYSSVSIFDPHSDVLEGCIDKFVKMENYILVRNSIEDYKMKNPGREFRIISPDAGALKKVYLAAENVGYTDEILIGSKHRDMKTGRITRTEVDLKGTSPNWDFFIIDDICDGGRTFIELAKVINSHVWPYDEYFRGKIYLVVSHGIFSAGLESLLDVFETIYTTDSIKEVNNERVHQLKFF
jgi:ribose-phosphate pyrophosphokinase